MIRGGCAFDRPATKRRAPVALLYAALATAFVAFAPASASAQSTGGGGGGPIIPPTSPTANTTQFSATWAQLDIGSIFLQRLGRNSTYSGNAAANSNPGGGGAPANDQPRYRSWAEVYGLVSETSAQLNFAGDSRKTFGGVGGFGVTIAPGLSVGVSVDESRTSISVPGNLQAATLGLTQIGAYAAYETGPWTFALAGIHGFADINSSRIFPIATFLLPHGAHYHGRISGGLAEVSYYWGSGQWRIVPKLAVEYTYSRTDAYTEVGLIPVTVGEASGERARVLIGAEVGHYWIVNQHVLDVSAYAKFIDNFHQEIDNVAVNSLGGALTAVGVKEATTGVDAGGMLSFGITGTARAYLAYDGKFRDGFTSHHGTAGLEFRF